MFADVYLAMWRRMILWIVLIAGGLFVTFVGFLVVFQVRMIFAPTRELSATPASMALPFEDVSIAVEPGVTVHGWYLPANGSTVDAENSKTVLFFHGNAGNISHRLETARFLVELGASVLLLDYRGYGRSEGSPSEDGLYADAGAAYEWLSREKNLSADDIVLFGRSLGGAVAVELASRQPCGGVIVESSFTSLVDMGRRLYPYVPVGTVLRYRFDSAAKMGQLRCPVLVAHSPDDELIPYDMGKKLYEVAPQPKQFVEIYGGHNQLEYFRDPGYRNAMSGFIHNAGSR